MCNVHYICILHINLILTKTVWEVQKIWRALGKEEATVSYLMENPLSKPSHSAELFLQLHSLVSGFRQELIQEGKESLIWEVKRFQSIMKIAAALIKARGPKNV